MIIIDNGLGIGASVSAKGSAEYNEKLEAQINGAKIYGESPALDCPQGGLGGYCFKISKCGLMASTFNWSGMPYHPDTPSPKPHH